MATPKVYNYQIDKKLDTILSQQQETTIAVARIEERLCANSDRIQENHADIKSLQKSDKQYGFVASILGVVSGFVTAIFAK